MKYRFTFSFALITILLVANNIKAETIQKNIGGLYYSLNTESKEAKVIRNYSASLRSIDIPESVEDEFGNTYYTDEAFALGRRIFDVIRNCIDNFSLDKDYKFNIEQVPKVCGYMAA